MSEIVPIKCGVCYQSEFFYTNTNYCSYCKKVVNPITNITNSDEETIARAQARRPKYIEISRHGDELRLVSLWYSTGGYLFMLFTGLIMGIIPLSVAIIWIGVIFSSELSTNETIGASVILLIASIVCLPLALISIGLLYYACAIRHNRSHVIVNPEKVTITHKPIPWFGNKSIDSFDIKQLYVKELVRESEEMGSSTFNQLWVKLEGSKDILLCESTDSMETMIFLEQAIENHLGIEDHRVAGEAPR